MGWLPWGETHARWEQESGRRPLDFRRFHILDPIYFHSSIKVQMQQIGAGDPRDVGENIPVIGPYVHSNGISNWLYSRIDDVCSCVYWYQNHIGAKLPNIPGYEERMKGTEVEENKTTGGFIAQE